MQAVTLVPVFYDRQAPGCPDEGLRSTVEFAWAPLLHALEQVPRVRIGLAVSGRLGRYVAEHHPDHWRLLRELAGRGQVEIIGGTSHGASLHLVPERDAVQQLRQHQTWLKSKLGVPIRGVWPTGLAWDPTVPRVIARSGGAYTFLDRGLLALSGGLPSAGGWVVTERAGAMVPAVPLDASVGEELPFVPLDDVVAALSRRRDAGVRVSAFPIAVESLGDTPQARQWCWEGREPWLPRLLGLLQQHASWLKTAVPWQLVNRTSAVGTAWPSSGTPARSGLDLLPPAAVEQRKPFLAGQSRPLSGSGELTDVFSGPPLETALARYDVAGRLHRASIRASAVVASVRRETQLAGRPAGPVESVGATLRRGQAALVLDPRRGGGLRQAGVRHAAFLALVDAELGALGLSSTPLRGVETLQSGPDGHPEVVLRGPSTRAVIRPGVGGAVSEISVRGIGNVVNTLARQREHWHDQLNADAVRPALVGQPSDVAVTVEDYDADEATDTAPVGRAAEAVEELPATAVAELIDDTAVAKHPVRYVELDALASLTAVDRGPRLCFQDRLIGVQTTLQSAARGQHPELGNMALAPYRVDRAETDADGNAMVLMGRDGRAQVGVDDVRLIGLLKRVTLDNDAREIRVVWEVWNRSKRPLRTRFASEINLCLDGRADAVSGVSFGDGVRHSLMSAFETTKVQELAVHLGESALVRMKTPHESAIYHYPILVPRRDGGDIVASYQGSCIWWIWPLELWADERQTWSLTLSVDGVA